MNNKEEFWKMLEEVEPINLLDPKTTKKEALKFYAGIMKAFAKFSYGQLDFNYNDYDKLSEVLKQKGCITLDKYNELQKVHPEFFSSGRETMGDLMTQPNDLGLPASAAANAIKNPSFTVELCFGKGDWCDTWLKCYEISLHETETF